MNTQPPFAVLTGDLIKSRRSDTAAVEAAFDALRRAATDFGQFRDVDLRFTRFRGDGWQVLTPAHLVLEAMLFVLARLRADPSGIETRISAGIGAVEAIGTANLSDATGTAFFASGDQLDSISPKRKLTLGGSGIDAMQVAIIDLAEFITDGWTAAQAEAVALSLQHPTHTHDDIAKALGITRQAVQSRLAGAGLSFFDNARHAFMNHDFLSTSRKPA